MSYLTWEVEIDHGRIPPADPEKLPENAKGLLTILRRAEPAADPKLAPLDAVEAFQKRMKLDEKKADEWMAIVPDARR